MNPLLVFPASCPPELAQVLDLADVVWQAHGTGDAARQAAPPTGWAGAIVVADRDAEGAWAMCRSLRKDVEKQVPVLLLINGRQIDDLELRDDLYDDFCLTPFHPRELERRLSHVLWRAGVGPGRHDLIEYDVLVLNVETYQASVKGVPLELTYMEYELLKFLAGNPGKVFTREVLLSRVWGYDYFGGARTVDVHIRRLRAKLGDEHASMIQTVRSVGYSFGESQWRA